MDGTVSEKSRPHKETNSWTAFIGNLRTGNTEQHIVYIYKILFQKNDFVVKL